MENIRVLHAADNHAADNDDNSDNADTTVVPISLIFSLKNRQANNIIQEHGLASAKLPTLSFLDQK